MEARVRAVGDGDARCVLPDINGLEAVLEREHVSRKLASDPLGGDVRDYVRAHDTLSARVLSVDAGNGLVKLTTRGDLLNDELRWEKETCGAEDRWYRVPAADELKERKAKADAEQRRRVPPRDDKVRRGCGRVMGGGRVAWLCLRRVRAWKAVCSQAALCLACLLLTPSCAVPSAPRPAPSPPAPPRPAPRSLSAVPSSTRCSRTSACGPRAMR